MSKIIRDPEAFSNKTYDLIVIGGGIYGIMLSYEASKRGLKSLLLEKNDFGSGTTFNFLRILHGGLRYLQTLDLHRFRESVAERKWFLQNFPDFAEPLPCLMPLYGSGLRRPSILKAASYLNDILSSNRNNGVIPERHLPKGRIISTQQTMEICPLVDKNGLKGGFVWYDAFMIDSQRFIMEILGRACDAGTLALNYVEAVQLLKDQDDVAGVKAFDRENVETYEYKSKVVINAAGPWCRDLAAHFDRDLPDLFRASLSWNVSLNKEPISPYALAVTPKKSGANTFFLLPWKGKILAGTAHAPWNGSIETPKPSDEILQQFLDDINFVVPSLKVTQKDILHVFSGFLPVTRDGSTELTVREVILNHANQGGPRGLYTISGVKFTTARRVAEKTLNKVFPERNAAEFSSIESMGFSPIKSKNRGGRDYDCYPSWEDEKWKSKVRKIIENEAVRRLDDLVFRRTNLWENPEMAIKVAPIFCEFFDWDDHYQLSEIRRLRKLFK